MRSAIRSSCILVAAIALALSVAGVGGAQGECTYDGLSPRMLTPRAGSIPRRGGGIVVARVPGAFRGELEAISLSRRRATQALAVSELAPGLHRLVPTAVPRAGAWDVVGLGETLSLTFGNGELPGVPVRPSVRAMRRVARAAVGTSAGAGRLSVRAELEFPVPVGTVAIVVTWNDEPVPAVWTPALLGQTSLDVYSELASCEPAPAGWHGPPDGPLTARIAYVDAMGQVSPASSAVNVE